MFRSELPFGIKRGIFRRSTAVQYKQTNTQFYLRSLALLCTESVFSYFPVSSFLTRILLKGLTSAYWKILIYSQCLDMPLTCPHPTVVMQKDHISVLCLQLFKKYYFVGNMAFCVIAFVKTRIKWVRGREDERITVLRDAGNFTSSHARRPESLSSTAESTSDIT